MIWFSSMAFAQGAGGDQPSMIMQLIPFLFMFVIIYFLMIRPQVKKQKAHTSFLSQLKRGDSVLTGSGIMGRVEGITDKWVTLEIADDVRIRIIKSQVASKLDEKEAQ